MIRIYVVGTQVRPTMASHDILARHEDRCLSTQEGESRDLRVLILMAGTVL